MEPCFPCIRGCCFDRGYFLRLRRVTFAIVEHRHFENFVIFCILLSSIALVSFLYYSLQYKCIIRMSRLLESQIYYYYFIRLLNP